MNSHPPPSKWNPLFRSILAVGLVAGPIVLNLFRLDASAIAWTNDTASYVTFQPFRQPGYGLFFNALKAMGLPESAIAVTQGLLFMFSLSFLVYELSRTRIPTGLVVAFTLIWWFPLNTGLTSLALSFVSEALYLPLVLVACGLTLRARRTMDGRNLVGAIAIGTICVFVREAALGLLPAIGLVLLLGLARGERTLKKSSADLRFPT